MKKIRPGKQGLYDPSFEHDACGVGFVVNITGEKSHRIIEQGIEVLNNLAHRGACGSDPRTGDGAGLLIQLPDGFLRKETAAIDINLPEAGTYAAGMIFLPQDDERRSLCMKNLEEILAEEGLEILGWRKVPTENKHIGDLATTSEPAIYQLFVGWGNSIDNADDFERKLYVVRKVAEMRIRELADEEGYAFYVASLSCRTIVYKGQLMAHQLERYFPDLSDPEMITSLALVHQRFSTNTFPSWELAQPFRYLGHNGEINTLRGNVSWMMSREKQFVSELFGDDIHKILPVIVPDGSDSACLDNVVEMLTLAGRSLPHVMMMLIPEAWSKDKLMNPDKRGFYEFHACLNEPWDGPAAITFTDGKLVGAMLDRNGLRPARYIVTKDGLLVMASEVGVLDFPPESIKVKGRLQPGRMLLVDTEAGHIIEDDELKRGMSIRRPYRRWVEENKIDLADLPDPPGVHQPDHETILQRQQAFGYSVEDIDSLILPMASDGVEPTGSMGNDAPLAVLSDKPVPLYNYFKQLFAQVTNPPIDSIREDLVMSLNDYIGRTGDLLGESPKHCRQLMTPHPMLTNEDLEKLRHVNIKDLSAATLPMLFPAGSGWKGLEMSLEALCDQALEAVEAGNSLIILSDRGVDMDNAPIPALLSVSAVHHHLIRKGMRSMCGIVVETGEAREVMHFALLIGYGASAINAYLVFETLADLNEDRHLPDNLSLEQAEANYCKAVGKGLLKIFSKMGISTLRSYRGARIFEALGLSSKLVDRYFTGTPSRIEGIGLDEIALGVIELHRRAFVFRLPHRSNLDSGGQYRYRKDGEYHQINPEMVAIMQQATRQGDYKLFKKFSALADSNSKRLATLRGLMKFKKGTPIPLEEVEPESEILKRFSTGAMSFGSLSKEAHETLAIAMNRIGAKSNTGEGGEDAERFTPDENGDLRRSAIKQVASGRFGVTANYLANADEIQIKIAQGAKPGEGGQLPGHKVNEVIARVRNSTPGVTLISPPPHHDIYSIEDLAQLIYDLKNANTGARISVKLVSEVGVGTIAAGVCKAHADMVLISGHDGGTGASPMSSIKHVGAPWELGLAETQQVLVMNNLRGRIRVQTDGQLKTGRDVVVAALLGAEEYGFSTLPLISLGCVMMRKCHKNTCPVGIATQDEELRKRFAGKPEHLVNYLTFVAREVREIMAELGFRTIDEMIGQSQHLDLERAVGHWKAKGLDLSAILHSPEKEDDAPVRCVEEQDHGLEGALDYQILPQLKDVFENKKPVELELPVRNTNRAVGTIISGKIAQQFGEEGLPTDTITLRFNGSAGQSFGAFAAAGLTLYLEGDANDYVGKGLSGGRIIVTPPAGSTFIPRENTLVGNVVLYGATSGEAYFRGVAGERFAIRNSGAHVVVEGVGDHGCEYMTGGVVVVLGRTGRNFAAGMSGGIAYVLDEEGDFHRNCNMSMVELEPMLEREDCERLHEMLTRYHKLTASTQAEEILEGWSRMLSRFVKVIPTQYRQALEERKKREAAING
jgi:glutamate synthase (ferredoxin)